MPDKKPSAAARLKQAEAQRSDALKKAERADASYESLRQARKRILAIIGRVRQQREISEGEKKLLATLRNDAKQLDKRADAAKAKRESQQKVADRLAQLINRLRQRLARHKVVMFDSIDVSQIPRDAAAAAGYTSGYWPTWNTIKAGPWPHKLSIAVTASHNDARCLDVEPGDATPDQAPGWVKAAKARGVKEPVLYSSLSVMPQVIAACSRAGISRSEYKVWTAHYNDKKHVCTPACGYGLNTDADATQWTDHSQGRNLDESLCVGSFFGG